MRKENRLINDFRWQTRSTIWKHLDSMAMNYAVYSTYLKGLAPHLVGFDLYLYAEGNNLVLICLDCCGHNAAQVYEESLEPSPVIFSEGHEPRPSVVWKLSETVRLLQSHLQNTFPEAKVYALLLTEAVIQNAGELEQEWEFRHIKVIDGFRKLKCRAFCVNADEELPGKQLTDAVKNFLPETAFEASDSDLATQPFSTGPAEPASKPDDDEEFRLLLEQFLHGDEEEETGNDDDLLDDEDELEETDDGEGRKEGTGEEDDADPQSPEEVDSLEEEYFPSGEVEQNQNLKVKVDVLRPFPHPRDELNKLVGCTEIKRRMDELVALTTYNKMLLSHFPSAKPHAVSLHSLFLGRPGTGKTTVCKIFGSLLRQAGALSKGHVVVCDRSTFIGTLWGDEERSVRQVAEMARGGVLMIDEAYLLCSTHEHDPGRIVLQQLMNILADERQRDIAVVLCGYKEPMRRLIEMNPGLASRFPNQFEFCDFTIDELLDITLRRVAEYDYHFTPQAWEKYRSQLTLAYQNRDPETWGNARYVANLLERIYIRHATRCVAQTPEPLSDASLPGAQSANADNVAVGQPVAPSELLTLTADDIVPAELPQPKARIGFQAA